MALPLFDSPPWLNGGMLGQIPGSFPQQQQEPGQGMLGRIGEGINSNPMTLMSLGAGIMQGGLGQGLQSAMAGSQLDQKNRMSKQSQMATFAALKARGLSDADAIAAIGNPAMLKALLPVAVPEYKPFSQGQSFGAFNPATGNTSVQGATPSFQTLSPGQTGGEYTPTMPAAPAQASDPNYTISPSQAQRANAPIPGSAAPIMPTPIPTTSAPPSAGGFRPVASGGSVVQHNADQAEGTAQGKARHAYPETVQTISSTLQNVQALRALVDKPLYNGMSVGDANLGPGRLVGWLSEKLGAEGSSEFGARVKQLEAKSFMTSIQSMQGLGALSNAEGLKATDAFTRLRTTQNPKVFKESLAELDDLLRMGLTKAKLQAFGRERIGSGGAMTPPPEGFTVVGQ